MVGCARPTLDENEDDSGEPSAASDAGSQPVAQKDAQVATPAADAGTGPTTPPPRDAGDPSVVVDTGVPADDGGDKLPPVLANCDSTTIKSTVPVGPAIVKGVSINGNASTMANVKTGASVDITISLKFQTCGAVYSAQSLFLGINDGTNATCQQTNGCSEVGSVPLPIPIPDLDFTITAPSTPGTYYVMAGLEATLCTPGSNSASVADTPVAALCVTK